MDHIEAGISVFQKYGPINQLESLSNGDVTKWEQIKAIDLATIFTKLRMNRDRHIFQKKLSEVLKLKNRGS